MTQKNQPAADGRRGAFWLLAAVPFVAAVPATAADLYGGQRNPSYQRSTPAFEAAPRPSIWSGLYIGIDGGYGWGRAALEEDLGKLDLNGGVYGGHLGYNWQMGSVVFGVETDAMWSSAKASSLFSPVDQLDVHSRWLSSMRLRAGYAVGRTLIYATGGLAVASYAADFTSSGTTVSASETVLGYAAGAGFEMKLTDSLSGRLEAIHYGFGNKTFDFGVGTLGADLSTTTVRAGLTYRFGG